nr:hypothetical protein [Maliibacterium massiliense]
MYNERALPFKYSLKRFYDTWFRHKNQVAAPKRMDVAHHDASSKTKSGFGLWMIAGPLMGPAFYGMVLGTTAVDGQTRMRTSFAHFALSTGRRNRLWQTRK